MKTKQITISLNRAPHKYTIFIGDGLLSRVGEYVDLQKYSGVAIITDKAVAKEWLLPLQKGIGKNAIIISVPEGEDAKTCFVAQKIWSRLLKERFDRKALIINIGGGAICDIGGFVAATYKRGIDFIQVPTTLLAQVDAAVGGKTGINFGGAKNMIGAMQQPIAVFGDISTLATLPKRVFIASFAEVIKHGLIADKEYLQFITSKPPTEFNNSELVDIIYGSCAIKTRIVESDETEQGARRLLNFGHTVGHAIEMASQETANPLLHGEAIAIGMAIEGRLSVACGLLSLEHLKQVETMLLAMGLPIRLKCGNIDQIILSLENDKKYEQGALKWTLLNSIGSAVFNYTVKQEEVLKILRENLLVYPQE
jgi:3-dehydroquinate synthase